MTKRETTLVKVTLTLGCKQRAARFAHCIRACGVINPTGLHPCSTEKAARWWLFQESSLPRLPVSNDPRPHQPIPTQRIPVPECKNSKCALRVPPTPPLFGYNHMKIQSQLITLVVRKTSMCTRPPYSLRVASQEVVTSSLFFFLWGGGGGDLTIQL